MNILRSSSAVLLTALLGFSPDGAAGFVPPAERITVFDNDGTLGGGIQQHIGRLDAGLDKAGARGWTVVDIRADWATVFPPVRR